MEGKKAYILPGVAALVLLVLFVLKSQTDDDPPAEPARAPGSTQAPSPPKATTKATIREALATAGQPTLSEDAMGRLQTAATAVVKRCRASRPNTDAVVGLQIEVISAKNVGARFERVDVDDDVPADLAGCVREGLLGSKPTADATGQGSMHWELDGS